MFAVCPQGAVMTGEGLVPTKPVLKPTDVPCPDPGCGADIGHYCRGLKGRRSAAMTHASRIRFRDGAQWAIDNLGAVLVVEGGEVP